MNDDEIKDPDEVNEENLEEDLDEDSLIPGKKKPKRPDEDDESLDELVDEEEAVLPEDDFEDKDLW